MLVNSKLGAVLMHNSAENILKIKNPKSGCMGKEIVEMDIQMTSKNDNRKIMKPIETRGSNSADYLSNFHSNIYLTGFLLYFLDIFETAIYALLLLVISD